MTDRGRWERMWQLHDLVARHPRGERAARLEAACPEDAELRREVLDLLDGTPPPSRFLEDSPRIAADELVTESPTPDPLLGASIGPYRILSELGRGGMGVVYEAEQREPVRRRVALKLIREGLESEELLARFASERQALATMSHPHIAKVFDVGATDAGRPYFVMEIVEGRRITDHCDQEGLTTRERVELFLLVCDAVQHAHQKGVVHRDLKPSNIVVARGDAADGSQARPIVVDFGVAKVLDPELDHATGSTRVGTFLGTPEYMSPEQWERAADADTRTDVYSLGVVLYELLTGLLPLDLTGRPLAVARKLQLEQEPERPSTRVSSRGSDESDASRGRRRGEPSVLRRELAGDLDWIVLRALEKDRERRYASVSELAVDLRRHLRDEPVLAGPPGAAYRMRKFVRRHRLGVAVASLVVLFLATLAAVMAVQTGRIARERDRANLEAQTAERVIEFLVELFRVADPGETLGETVTARELLERGATSVDEELGDEPAVRSRLLGTLGDVYGNLGLYDQAEPLLEQALEIRRELLGESDPSYAEALGRLGALRTKMGALDEAGAALESALAVLERARPRDELAVARTAKMLADVYSRQGTFAKAIDLYDRALAAFERAHGEEDVEVVSTLLELGYTYRDADRLPEARASLTRGLAIANRVLPAGDPKIASLLNAIGIVYWTEKDYAGARPYFERSLKIIEEIYPEDHPNLAAMRNNVGRILMDAGDPLAARPLLETALATRERILPPDHPDLAATLTNLARLHAAIGEHRQALPLFERGLRIWQEKLEEGHRFLAEPLAGYAASLHAVGRSAEAGPRFERAISIREARLGASDVSLLELLDPYEAFLRDTGQGSRADEIAARAEAIRAATTGNGG